MIRKRVTRTKIKDFTSFPKNVPCLALNHNMKKWNRVLKFILALVKIQVSNRSNPTYSRILR